MIRVERIDNICMFSNEELGLGFSCSLNMNELTTACKPLGLPADKIDALYHRLLEFQVAYTENGKLFKSTHKKAVDPLSIKYDKVGEVDPIDGLVERTNELADAVSKNFIDGDYNLGVA